MSIAPGNTEPIVARHYRAASDPIPPVQDLNIPIPDHKPPPLAEDFHKRRDQRRRQPDPVPAGTGRDPAAEGHIDEYA